MKEIRGDITFRTYTGRYGVSEDYIKVHDFLVESGNEAFPYARFDWMITHRPYLQEEFLNRIGLWEQEDKIVAVALFDTALDDIFIITLKGYEFLYEQMIDYACTHMVNEKEPQLRLFIDDANKELQQAASVKGLHVIDEQDKVAQFDLTQEILEEHLSQGYTLVDLETERDYDNYLHCLFRGFDHDNGEETYVFEEADMREAQSAYERDCVDLKLKISVKAPGGKYVAHCGMWYDPLSKFAVVEPVCTDPNYCK